MKFETILSAFEVAIVETYEISDNPHPSYWQTRGKREHARRNRQTDAFRARLLSMYSGDFLRFIENSRNYWRDRAYLVDQDNRDLRERLEELENAWAVDETIQPDGILRPSLAGTVKRAAELEAENIHLRQENEDHIRSINEMCNGLWELLYPDNPNGWQYRTQPLVHIRVELEELRDQLEGGLDG